MRPSWPSTAMRPTWTDLAVLRCGRSTTPAVAQPVAHALEVAAQDGAVENEGGRRKVVDRLVCHLEFIAHAD